MIMLLRWLVSNYLRQTAEQALRETASEMLTHPRRSGEAEGDDVAQCDVAVLFALPIESAGLVDQLSDGNAVRLNASIEHLGTVAGKNVVIANTGVGQKSAAAIAAEVIEFHRPRWVISAGFAGGLHDDVRPGHLLLVDKVASLQGDSFSIGLQCDPQWLATARGVHAGKLLTVADIVSAAAEKRRLGEEHSAIACDMETFAITDVCRQLQTPLIAVRIITDAVDDTLPPEIDRLMRQKTMAGKLGAAAGAIFSRPTAAKDLWDLRGVALKSSDRLAKFLVGMIEQLPTEAAPAIDPAEPPQ
jgi:adenosylhomocysteine nucleosidase